MPVQLRTALTVCLALTALAATPQTPDEVCPPDAVPLEGPRLLHNLSLDLRGYAPDLDEYDAVLSGQTSTDTFIDQWLKSDDFAQRAVRHHRALVWPNITNVRLISNSYLLSTSGELYYRRNPALSRRGDLVPCLDEPVAYDASGGIVARQQPDGTTREGYVRVRPYWAPDTEIKVCAYDALTTAVASSGQRCDRRDAADEIECGCGPDLRWCSNSLATDAVILESYAEDLERRVAAVIQEDRSYLDLFQGRQAWVNGPIVHHLRYQREMYNNVNLEPSPVRLETLPDLEFTDVDTWVPVQLDPNHAGILTSPAYLLRFQTNRSRANQFYNAFLCEPFQPPSDGLPAPDETKAPPLDLQVRDGCKYCHALLEPSASYWGRWTQSGGGYLDPDQFPAVRADCLACALGSGNCSQECRTHYVVDALTEEQEPWLGYLRAYEFRREAHQANIENGPRVLAASAVVDGRLPSCAARTSFTWLMGRPPTENEGPWVDELALDFVRSGYSFQHLVEAIVTSDTYRRPE